jgi:hypothetical protein
MPTISEAYAAWTEIEVQCQDVDGDTCTRLASELSRVEQATVQVPVTCQLGGW